MAYSVTGIANITLIKIGADTITAITDTGDEKARKLNATWEYIRNEVLETKDWIFAKERVELAKSTETPVFGFDFMYALPSNFLRLSRKKPHNMPINTDFSIESGYLLTDYDNTSTSLFISYIKVVTDPTKYTAAFINALSFRWAAEVCERITGGSVKRGDMMQGYLLALQQADSLNQMTEGMVEDEDGSEDWLNAGRSMAEEGGYVLDNN